MKLSIPMMVKNESKHIEDCLKALLPIMEEIDTELIIVDTGSEDNTVEIAKKYTDKVYFHKWNNNFSEMRNITLSYITGDWILIVDGDEILENPKSIIEFLQTPDEKKHHSGLINIKNVSNEEKLTFGSSFLAPRLVKNRTDIKFTGAVHNQINHKGPYFELQSNLIHYGYISTDQELMEKKFERTATILKAELEKDPKNIYYWYQLSVSYGMYKDHYNAVEPAEKAYALIKSKDKSYMYVYLQLIKAYIAVKRYSDANKICEEALSISIEYIDLQFYSGKISAVLKQNEKAINHYKKYLKLLENLNKSNAVKDLSVINYTLEKYEEVYYDLVILYCETEEFYNALNYLEKIESHELRLKLSKNIIHIHVNTDTENEIKDFYEKEILIYDSKVIKTFETHIENAKKTLDKKKRMRIQDVFTKVNTPYRILNTVQLQEELSVEEVDEVLLDEIKELNFNKLPVFYGDIIFYLLKRKRTLVNILKEVRDSTIDAYLEHYLAKYKSDYSKVIVEYIKESKTSDLISARVHKELTKYALMQDNLEDDEFKYIFYRYIEDGTFYISKLYHPDIIEDEMIYDIKKNEDVFLMYLYKGIIRKEEDPKEYIRYVRKALSVYPFTRGVEILKQEIENEINPPVDSEIELLKIQFKENIKNLIENKMITEAEDLINQYEKLVSDDIELLLLKSQISLIKLNVKEDEGVIN